MSKGEIARIEQFLLLSQCFQKAVCCRGVYMRERVKIILNKFSFCHNVFKCCLLQRCQKVSGCSKGLKPNLYGEKSTLNSMCGKSPHSNGNLPIGCQKRLVNIIATSFKYCLHYGYLLYWGLMPFSTLFHLYNSDSSLFHDPCVNISQY